MRTFPILALLTVLAVPPVRATPAPGRLEVPLTGLRNLGKGQLLGLLYRKVERIDADPGKAVRQVRVPARTAQQVVTFEDVPAGEYAVAVVHDMDGNGKLTTTFLGVPDEDLAISRNAKGGPLGGPKWADARFDFAGGTLRLEPLVVKYFYD